MVDLEKQLIVQLKSGCEDAYEQLFNRHNKQVFLIAYGFLRNREDAMEIVQETFLKVYRNIASVKEDGATFKGWINQIARNLSIDYYRKNKKLMERSTDLNEDMSESQNINPYEKMEKDNLTNKIKSIVYTLSKKQQTVFIMKHFQGMKFKEIAAQLSVTEGTVKKLHFRAMEAVRKELGCFAGELK